MPISPLVLPRSIMGPFDCESTGDEVDALLQYWKESRHAP
jgi:hypothetical protein